MKLQFTKDSILEAVIFDENAEPIDATEVTYRETDVVEGEFIDEDEDIYILQLESGYLINVPKDSVGECVDPVLAAQITGSIVEGEVQAGASINDRLEVLAQEYSLPTVAELEAAIQHQQPEQ